MIVGAMRTKHPRRGSQKAFGSRVLRSRISRRKWSAYRLVAVDPITRSRLEPGIREQCLRARDTVIDRLPWSKAPPEDFVRDGPTRDSAVPVHTAAAWNALSSGWVALKISLALGASGASGLWAPRRCSIYRETLRWLLWLSLLTSYARRRLPVT